MKAPADIGDLMAASWPSVLENLQDAVIVMDGERVLRFVNDAARRLLGYAENDVIGGRCRLTTGGLDCDEACPLTWAVEHGEEVVRDFAAIYRTKAGDPVPLRVTIIPLRGADGVLTGAMEILRPTEPVLGFVVAGSSPLATRLRRRVMALGRSAAPVTVIGERTACRDLARAIHRAAGLPDGLFREGVVGDEPWPPGTLYVDHSEGRATPTPAGWRLVQGRREPHQGPTGGETVVLPPLAERRDDLPLMVAVWAEQLEPRVRLTPEATERLTKALLERGPDAFAEVLGTALAGARATGELGSEQVPVEDEPLTLVDEILEERDPLNSLEARVLLQVLERCGWRMQEAADRLGMSRVTLWRKLREHGIHRPGSE